MSTVGSSRYCSSGFSPQPRQRARLRLHTPARPGVTSKQITIGGTFPFTGPASLYKTIPVAEQAYFAYVNAKNGTGCTAARSRTSPSTTATTRPRRCPDVKKLVEKDHVFAVVGSLGTAPGLATWGYLNKHKVPQVLLATGDAYWGNCVHHGMPGLGEAVDDGLAAGLPR